MRLPKNLSDILEHEIDPAFAERALFIFQEIQNAKPKRILDAGCGRGFYVNALRHFDFPKEIAGIDINSDYVKAAQKNSGHDPRIHIEKGSIYHIKVPDNYFDAIICSEVLEHLEDENKALSEIRRVLKKDGVLLITVPHENFPFLWDPLNWILMRFFRTHVDKDIWWLAGIWAGHLRLYDDKALRGVLKRNGFSIKKHRKTTRHCWPFSHFMLYGIGKNLVERCGCAQFSRFSEHKGFLSRWLAHFFALPSKLDSDNDKQSVCHAVAARKE